jgi:hypothetical protein
MGTRFWWEFGIHREVEEGVIDNAGVSEGKRRLQLMYIDAPEAGRHMTNLIPVTLLLGQRPKIQHSFAQTATASAASRATHPLDVGFF